MGYGIKFMSATSKEIMDLSAFGFVDNMDYVQQTALEEENEADALSKTQEGIQLW